MKDIDWSVFPSFMKEKYSSLTECEHDLLVSQMLNENGTAPIELDDTKSSSFNIFSKEYNSVLITAHLFENLLMFEDIRHEDNGHNWFQIEIPVEYFRYPAFNNIKDQFSYKKITEEEKKLLENVISTTKKEMHYANDENIVKENLHRLEFISYFSYFEAYLENILIECLDYEKKTASNKAKYNSIDKLLKIVINEISPNIEILLTCIKNDFFKFMHFCYLVRNLHTHNLGRANYEFMMKCIEKDLIEEDYGITESGEEIPLGHIKTNYGQPDKVIELNRYITLSVLSYDFRNYIREIVFIIESCLLEKRSIG